MDRLNRKFSWWPVIIFFLIAVAISGPFFYWRTILNWEGFRGPGFLKTMSYMWGPGIAGLVCYGLYRRRFTKEITIWGTSFLKSLVIWVAPFLLLAILGIRDESGELNHVLPLMLIGIGFLTIWGEEIGWRWFLQDYLKPLHPLKKYILIGVLWEVWHLRFLSKLDQALLPVLFSSLVIMLVAILLSIIIGFVTDRSKSLTFACALHAWVDMVAEFGQASTYIAAGFMVMLCVVFVVRRKNTAPLLTEAGQRSDTTPTTTGNGQT